MPEFGSRYNIVQINYIELPMRNRLIFLILTSLGLSGCFDQDFENRLLIDDSMQSTVVEQDSAADVVISDEQDNQNSTNNDSELNQTESTDQTFDEMPNVIEAQKPATLTSPQLGDLIESTSIKLTFNNLSAQENWLYIGTSINASDILMTKIEGDLSVDSIPLNGDPIYVTLFSFIEKKWHSNQYEFKTKDLTQSEELMQDSLQDKQQDHEVVDIMVLYNQSAQDNVDVQSWINGSIAYTNQVLENSRVNIRYRLVHTEKAPEQYNVELHDRTPWDLKADLRIQTLRNQYGADVVGLISRYAVEYCGYGQIPYGDSETKTFNGVDHNYFWSKTSCGYRNFAHEVGHVMGLGHSVAQGSKGGVYDWARGWGNHGQFATMMAYASAYGLDWGTELPFYSNPQIIACKNQACGNDKSHTDGADAASFLNEFSKTIASLRPDKITASTAPLFSDVRIFKNSNNACLSINERNMLDSGKVTLTPCIENKPSQQWHITEQHQIKSAQFSDFCLQGLTMRPCDLTIGEQTWNLTSNLINNNIGAISYKENEVSITELSGSDNQIWFGY